MHFQNGFDKDKDKLYLIKIFKKSILLQSKQFKKTFHVWLLIRFKNCIFFKQSIDLNQLVKQFYRTLIEFFYFRKRSNKFNHFWHSNVRTQKWSLILNLKFLYLIRTNSKNKFKEQIQRKRTNLNDKLKLCV